MKNIFLTLLVLCTTSIPVHAQTVSTVEGPKQFGALDTSACESGLESSCSGNFYQCSPGQTVEVGSPGSGVFAGDGCQGYDFIRLRYTCSAQGEWQNPQLITNIGNAGAIGVLHNIRPGSNNYSVYFTCEQPFVLDVKTACDPGSGACKGDFALSYAQNDRAGSRNQQPRPAGKYSTIGLSAEYRNTTGESCASGNGTQFTASFNSPGSCAAQDVSWTEGGRTCTGPIEATVNGGIVDTETRVTECTRSCVRSGGRLGCLQFATTCAEVTNQDRNQIINYYGSRSFLETTRSNFGRATFECRNGSYVYQGGGSCAP